MKPHRLSRADARRLAIRAQLLDAERPGSPAEVVDELTVLNIDPTNAIAPSEDHMLYSRLGGGYEHAHLSEAFENDKTVFEYDGMYRAGADLGLYRAVMRRPLKYQRARDWMAANARFHRDVVALVAERGPLPTGEIPDTAQQPWGSSGWTNNRNVTQMLELLVRLGEVAIAGRRGRERLWDLAERWYPPTAHVPDDEVDARRNERRLGALGIARAQQTEVPLERLDVGAAGEPALVDGVDGQWRVDPVGLDELGRRFEGRTVLLSPFDRLVFDRCRAEVIFGFEYALEMYKPAAKRRWGYFVLPILRGDELIGKLDAKTDRKAGLLRVNAVHRDRDWSRAAEADVRAEIGALAEWLGLEVSEPDL
ncbi:DNA glycosylase AlkZ-like family protein [Micropruina sp.]|uniref:DNA glycosylase AlkZ-like family protein n=1 Tax=Micropruina sp. TaxID=2737536 RepID=UPI0039E4AD48